MASLEYSSVVSGGAGWTKVKTPDGRTLTIKGTRSTRNNNPGNIEYGKFARRHGAIGSDGRFAVFPTREQGFGAIGALVFGPNYENKTLKQAIAKYAPPFENNSTAYANKVARTVGVPLSTKMRDIPQNLRIPVAQAMATVEGRGSARVYEGGELVGRISGRDGQSTVAPSPNLEQMATEAGLYDTIMGRAGAPMEQPFPVPESSLEHRASQAGLYDTIMGPAGAASPYMPAGFPTPEQNPRSMGALAAPEPSLAPRAAPQVPVNAVRPSTIGDGVPAARTQQAPTVPALAPTPSDVAARNVGGFGSPQQAAPQAQVPALNTPPAEYQHPAFSEALPKVNAYQQPPVPGLQQASSGPALEPGELGFDAKQEEPGGLGLDAVPADQLGNPPRSTASKVARGLAPIAASAVAGPIGGLAVRGLQALGDKRAQSDPGYFPDAPKSSGGFFGNIFGSSAPLTGETTSVADILRDGPGNASYAGSGVSGIQGVMSSTGPGAGPNASIGTVAASRSNPGFSVVGLGPMGYGRQSSKYSWTEDVTPFGTAHHANTAYEVTVDPATGKRSVSRVSIGKPGKRSVIAATRGPSRGLSFGRGKGLASFFSSLFGPTMTTPAPAVNPAAVAFAPGPTTGPMGFGLGANGAGVGFGGLAGSFGPAGPAFGGGAHSNSTDSRGP